MRNTATYYFSLIKGNALHLWNEMFILSRILARRQSQNCEQLIWSKVAGCSYTDPLKRNIFYESFFGKFLSSCSFVLPWVAGSERLNSKASLLKTRKTSKNQKKILACALENGCSKTSTAGIFLRMFRLFSDKLLHKISMNDWYERVFICLVRQIIIASVRKMSKYNKRSTAIAFRILVKLHKSLEGTKPFARGIL